MWLDWLNSLGQFTAIGVVVWSCLKTFQTQPTSGFLRVWFQLILYYARYFMAWVLLWSGVMLLSPLASSLHWATLILAGVYVYASWIEPNLLKVNHAKIHLAKIKNTDTPPTITLSDNPTNALKIAVISDIHVGIFSGKPHQLNKLVKTINELDVSAVLIAGDWLYHAGADILGQMVVLKALNKPCYTVFSESDSEQITTEIDPQNQLTHVLQTLDIQIINDTSVELGGVTLLGAGVGANTRLGAKSMVNQPLKISTNQPLVILTHDIKNLAENANHLLNNDNPKLIIAGQTHGGQVFVPYLTQFLIKAMTGTQERAGLSTYTPDRRSRYQVWTATGTGMTGLPFRLNCPPRIDILTLYV